MATITYSDGNQGFWNVFGLWAYSVGNLTNGNTVRTLRYDEELAGEPLDATQRPDAIRFIFGGVTSAIATAGSFAGQRVLTGGALTGVTLTNDTGATIMTITGLNIPAALADSYIRKGDEFGLMQLVYSSDMKIVGSNDSSGPSNDWTGDDISTGKGKDTVLANGGDDFIKDMGGADSYNGGSGFDTLTYEEGFFNPQIGQKGIVANLGKGTVTGPDGQKDKVISIEGITGSVGNDKLTGSAGENELSGMGGNDTLDGGKGIDWVSYRNDSRENMGGGLFGVTVTLGEGSALGSATDGFGGNDVLKNIENIRGSDLGDSLTGNSAVNMIFGRDGDDTITGGGGDDVLRGDGGDDTFVFAQTDGNDYIDDFEIEVDHLSIAGISNIETQISLTEQDDGVEVRVNGNADFSIFLHGLTLAAVGDGTILFDLP